MIKVKVGNREVKVLRTWEKEVIATAVAVAGSVTFIMLWISGTLGSWT